MSSKLYVFADKNLAQNIACDNLLANDENIKTPCAKSGNYTYRKLMSVLAFKNVNLTNNVIKRIIKQVEGIK